MILLVCVMLAVLPTIIGGGVMTMVYRKKERAGISFSDSYLLGLSACIGMGELAHAAGLLGRLRLAQTGTLFGMMLAVVTAVSLTVMVVACLKNRSRFVRFSAEAPVSLVICLLFFVILLLQVLFLALTEPVGTPGDITLETVQSFLAQDGIYRVMPLTGMVSEQGMPLRYTILCLPTIYAIISQSFGIEPELLVCHVIPIVVLVAAYLAYYRLSGSLFGRKKLHSRCLFLLMAALILTFSDGAVFLDGYSALHSGYMGVAIRNLVLVPYALSAALEGRWWKAVICILAEACIAWTFMGYGVCVVIVLGILILEILRKRFPAVGKYLQFFREKEAQP